MTGEKYLSIIKKKKRKKRGDSWVIEEEGSDHPIHERYVEEEPAKQ